MPSKDNPPIKEYLAALAPLTIISFSRSGKETNAALPEMKLVQKSVPSIKRQNDKIEKTTIENIFNAFGKNSGNFDLSLNLKKNR